MKNVILTICLLVGTVQAQEIQPLKTFKSKDVKIRASSLYDVKLNEQSGELTLISTIKNNTAEKLYFNADFTLKNKVDTTFDFVANDKKRKQLYNKSSGSGINYQNISVDLLKADVIEIVSADAFSKSAGINIINKGKIGLKNPSGFSIQKGDIQFVTNVIGDRVRTFTTFVSKEEMRLKSEEGKNLTYEFHASSADGLQFEFKESDSYNKSKTNKINSFVSQESDLLLISKRKPIIKFGKAPSDADLLPVYYIHKISPKTMDIGEPTILKEPVSRGIIYREKLELNAGVILISAPLDITGEKVPKDPNPRNYVFRLIGNDTKVKFEINYEVPSGFTQFSNAFELADKSIVLIAAINNKKKDKYFNQGTFSIPEDAYYILTIKNGVVTSNTTINSENFNKSFIIPKGEKMSKRFFNPAFGLTNPIGSFNLKDGGLITAWQISYDINGKSTFLGNLVLHFNSEGKLNANYWIGAKTEFSPNIEAGLFMKNESEFYLLSHVANEKGEIEESWLNKIILSEKSIGEQLNIADDKHVLSSKFPFITKSNWEIQFFGFDKSGKEIWTQLFKL